MEIIKKEVSLPLSWIIRCAMGVEMDQQRLNTDSTKKKENKNVWVKHLDYQFVQNFHQMINIEITPDMWTTALSQC